MKKYGGWNISILLITVLIWIGMVGVQLYESSSRSLTLIREDFPGNILRILFLFLFIQYFTPGILVMISVKQDRLHDRVGAITFAGIALGISLLLVPVGRFISRIAMIEVPYEAHAYYGHIALAVVALIQLIRQVCKKNE